jgi:hypothetical protein
MLPQTDTSDAAAAAGECCHVALLPLAMLLCVLALVPVDSRLRCAEVCRGWRVAVADRRLWLRLDLSHTSGVGYAVSDALLLCAAAARAAGSLQELDLTGCNKTCCNKKHLLEFAAVMAAVTANARTLRELRLCDFRDTEDETTLNAKDISALLAVATQLQVLDVEAGVNLGDDARRMLRGEPPFGPLRLRNVSVSFMDREYNEAIFLACLADVASHTWTTGLQIYDAWLDNPVALDAVVDLALARRFTAVSLRHCWLSPASVPALARLLGSSALTELVLRSSNYGGPQPFEDVDTAAQLAAALRANSTLQRLELHGISLWGEPGAATILLCALINHSSVRELSLAGNQVDDNSRAVAVALVSAMLRANTPLRLLKLDDCNLRDEGLGPVVDALARNTHLTRLDIGDNNRTKAFMRDRLLPAVRANRSLRELNAWEMDTEDEEDKEWQQTADAALLDARSEADDAAARVAAAVDGLSLQARV